MLWKINQSQEGRYYVISFIQGTWNSQTDRDREYNSSCQELWGVGNGEWVCKGDGVADDAEVLQMAGGDGCLTAWMDLTPLVWARPGASQV